jgi:hypothetical protein
MKRVSTARPPKSNCFHRRVPAGNSQASGRVASIAVPGGKRIQRRFAAPSDHSGYCGANGSTPGAGTPGRPAA